MSTAMSEERFFYRANKNRCGCSLKTLSEPSSLICHLDHPDRLRLSKVMMPREMSSKMMPASCLPRHRKCEVPVKNWKPIDPRFSHLYGEFDRQKFEENYKFLKKIKKKEKKKLMKTLSTPDVPVDECEQEKMKLLLQRMNNQNEEKAKQKQKNKLKNDEREYQINELKEGRRPQYYKKSDKKLFDLVSQFEELKEKGGLTRHIKRRRKKLNRKDRRNLHFLNSF